MGGGEKGLGGAVDSRMGDAGEGKALGLEKGHHVQTEHGGPCR